MICINCKEPIINPIEHEFCAFVPDPQTTQEVLKKDHIVPGNQPPHRPKKWEMPKQKPISKSKLAPPISKPPSRITPINLNSSWDYDNGRQDSARKAFENME